MGINVERTQEEYELLLKRFRHLLESDFIRSYDEWNMQKKDYTKDITKLDIVIAKKHYDFS